jgi:hypothetical protein
VLVLGRGKGDAGEQKAADVIDDREWVAVLVVAEKELALVVREGRAGLAAELAAPDDERQST